MHKFDRDITDVVGCGRDDLISVIDLALLLHSTVTLPPQRNKVRFLRFLITVSVSRKAILKKFSHSEKIPVSPYEQTET